jgi:hypothetical protein
LLACDRVPLGYDQLERDLKEPRLAAPLPVAKARCYGSFNTNNANGQLTTLVIGRNYAYESRVLFEFALADSAPTLDSVDSARLVLCTRIHEPVSFQIYPLTADWEEEQASWHDAETGIPWFNQGGDFDATQLIACGTSEEDSTLVLLPVSCLSNLVHNAKGLILIPQDDGSGNLGVFHARSVSGKSPEITYFYGSHERTFEALQNTFIADTIGLNLAPGKLWLGSGYVFRSYLYFDLDSLSDDSTREHLRPDSTMTVTTGALTIYPESSFTVRETLTVAAHRLTQPYEPAEQNAGFDPFVVGDTFVVRDDTGPITLDIRPIVQRWIEKPDSNFGLLVTLEPQNFDVSRMELKRGTFLPFLRIGYVEPPHGRNHR